MKQTHKCAICADQIPRDRLMCEQHWRAVPIPLRHEYRRLFGVVIILRQPGEPEFQVARQAAIDYVLRQLDPQKASAA